jgi:hypothetical protein
MSEHTTTFVGPSSAEAHDAREAVAVLATERLEAEITELASRLAAGECRWLLLVAEFDRREGWRAWGCASIVHWLGWHCGIDPRSARERVRVARALLELGAVREAFAAGVLSYSKVRAITRVATPATEVELVAMARTATAAQIERAAAVYRRVLDPSRAAVAQRSHERRRVDRFDDVGGFSARLCTTHDDGRAFDGALDHLVTRSVRARPLAEGETMAHRRADVLVETVVVAAQGGLAAGGSASGPAPLGSPAERHLVVVNVDATVLTADHGAVCEIDGGPGVSAETARRVACDAHVVSVIKGYRGSVVGGGPARRLPSPSLRRRLHARDQGGRFPGCGERRVVSAHHVHHWARGGRTDLDNLVEVCRFHHRLVHEGGWSMKLDRHGVATFTAPDGRTVVGMPFLLPSPAGPVGDGTWRNGSAEPLVRRATLG